ncbi:MAG: thioredoxin family protein [Armatimonadota bacterium]|nr:thioredoxin family protein [bacterium]
MKTLLSILALTLSCVTCAVADTAVVTVKDTYPTLTSGALASARLVELPSGTILRSGQINLTQKDLDAEIAKSPEAIRSQLKRNLFFVLENKATQDFLEYEADAWTRQNKTHSNLNQDDLVKSYLSSLADKLTVSDEETKAFFDKNADMMGGATFDQVKDQLKDYVLDQKRQDAIDAHIASMGTRYEIDVDNSWAAKQYSAAIDNPIDKARVSGKPTMVDLGADGCRPCDMMTPILESLKSEYAGRVNVLFVHVRKEQVLAARYGVQSIPVQVFFDKDGKEVYRHLGFFPKDQIVAKLAEMGVK